MNTAIQYNRTSYPEQSTTSNYSLYLLRGLSSSAKILYIEMRRVSGVKGYLSCSVDTLTTVTGRSKKQTSRLLHELENNGLIDIWLHPGRESEYVIKDVYFRQGMDIKVQPFKKKNFKEITVKNQRPNVILLKPQEDPCPTTHTDPCETPKPIAAPKTASEPVIERVTQQEQITIPQKDTVTPNDPGPLNAPGLRNAPVRMDLVREILVLTNDHKSTGFWIKFVRLAPVSVVYVAISSLKSALNEGIVCHPGRYMVGIIRRLYPEMFSTQQTTTKPRLSQVLQQSSAPIYPTLPHIEPMIEIDWSANKENLRRIREMLDTKSSLITREG